MSQFLGTDANRGVFWIEPNIDDVLENFERNPDHKFFLIKVTGKTVTLKPITFSEEPESRPRLERIARAEGNALN